MYRDVMLNGQHKMHLVICRRKKIIDKKQEEFERQDRTLRDTAVIREGEREVEPSTVMEIERTERKFALREKEQSEGGKSQRGEL